MLTTTLIVTKECLRHFLDRLSDNGSCERVTARRTMLSLILTLISATKRTFKVLSDIISTARVRNLANCRSWVEIISKCNSFTLRKGPFLGFTNLAGSAQKRRSSCHRWLYIGVNLRWFKINIQLLGQFLDPVFKFFLL